MSVSFIASAFRDALKDALAADADLQAWSTKWFQGQPTFLIDYQSGPARDDEHPTVFVGRCLTFQSDEPRVGGAQVGKTISVPIEIRWVENDPSRANDEHCELHDTLTVVALRNRSLGGASLVGGFDGQPTETEQPQQGMSGAVQAQYLLTT